MQADNSARLAAAAQARHEQTIERARAALMSMVATGEAVTIARLAARAAVSRSWIYTQPELRDQIEQLQTNTLKPSTTAPAVTQASADSLRRRLTLAHQTITQLRTENQHLRDTVARIHGQLREEHFWT